MIREFTQTPLFGILLSLVAFEIGVFLNRKTKISLVQPILIALIFILIFLSITGISYENYKIGGDYISLFLSPVTVILAVPLYKQLQHLKKHLWQILIGISVGSLTSLLSILFFAKLFEIQDIITLSIAPKSITIPMGIEVSKQIGGIPSITILSIVITGITGAVSAPIVCRICKIKEPIAQGTATGTASHALGTTQAFEMGEIQGAMSSLSIGLTGIITAISAPMIISLFF